MEMFILFSRFTHWVVYWQRAHYAKKNKKNNTKPKKEKKILKNRLQNAKATRLICDVELVRNTLNRIKFVEPLFSPLFAQTFAITMVMSASTLSYRGSSFLALVTPTRIQVWLMLYVTSSFTPTAHNYLSWILFCFSIIFKLTENASSRLIKCAPYTITHYCAHVCPQKVPPHIDTRSQ